MYKKAKKIIPQEFFHLFKCLTSSVGIIIATLVLPFCVMQGCILPEAVRTEIQGIKSDVSSLEKIVDQKADNTVVAKQVDQIHNRIEQTTQIAEQLSLWRQRVEADTINYGGAGWVVVGTGVMALIFVGAGFLLIRAFMKRGNLLTFLTYAIQKVGKSSPDIVSTINRQLKYEVDSGKFSKQDKQNLSKFVRKHGTFAEQK